MSEQALRQPTPRTRNPWPGPKILTGAPYQDGPVLANRLGLQFARIATAKANWRARKRPVDTELRPYVEAYERDGVVPIENFLPEDVFEAIRAECRAAHEEGLFSSECVEDNGTLEETLVVKRHKHRMETTWKTLGHHEWLMRLVSAITRLPPPERFSVEVSYMSKTDDAPPPERMVGTNYLHADVHYPSAKAWLALNDIDEENGAFVYAKGSQKMSPARLLYEYDASVRVARAKRDGSIYRKVAGGAVRMPMPWQMRAMGIVEAPMRVKPNTLLVANVGGFHRRGEFAEGRRREQIQLTFADRPGQRDKK